MPLVQINASGDQPELSGQMPLARALAGQIRALPDGAPIVVLLHGYKFSPFRACIDPHSSILSLQPRPRARTLSWPRHLGFGRGKRDEGLCIAFGWEAHGLFWRAYREAERAGQALAELLDMIAGLTDRPVDIVCHSLGARVALSGIARARGAQIGRVILMAAAEFQSAAAGSLLSPAGQKAEFINIISRENDMFDLVVERLLQPFGRTKRALGDGLMEAAGNWLDIQIDHPEARAALGCLGHRIAEPTRRICHWSGYLRPGMLAFYSELIRNREHLSMPRLRTTLPVNRDRRWSRLFAVPELALPLSLLRNASS